MDDTSRRVGDRDQWNGREAEDVAGRSAEAVRGYAESPRADLETDRRTSEIRRDIEDTREEMADTIDAIQEKLRPRNIVAQATDRVKQATTERVREMADTATETAQDAMIYTRDTAGGFVDTIRQNPVPAALIGIGTAWLLTNRRSTRQMRDRDDWYDRGNEYPEPWSSGRTRTRYARSADDVESADVSGSAQRAVSRAREYASETTDAVRRRGRRAQNQLQRMIQDNPLLVGAGALMLGAAFGLAVPETDIENQYMGEARDNLVERAQDMARDAASKVQEAAGSVADTAGTIAGSAKE